MDWPQQSKISSCTPIAAKVSNVAADVFRLAGEGPAGAVRRCNAGVIKGRLSNMARVSI
jgi:hypothetical protein